MIVQHVELNDYDHHALDAAIRQLPVDFVVQFVLRVGEWWNRPDVEHVPITLVDRIDEELEDGHAFLKSHVADLGADPHDRVLHENFAEDIMLVALLDVFFRRLGTVGLTLGLPVVSLALDLKMVQQLSGGILLPVDSTHTVNQELEEVVHLSLIGDDEVDVAVLEDERDALPRVERHLRQLCRRHRVEVLSQDPEAGVGGAKDEVLNVGNIATGRARQITVVRVNVHLLEVPS